MHAMWLGYKYHTQLLPNPSLIHASLGTYMLNKVSHCGGSYRILNGTYLPAPFEAFNQWMLFIYLTMHRPAKIDHVSANYTELYFAYIFHSECNIPFFVNFRWKSIKFCSSDDELFCCSSINSYLVMIE